MKQRLLISLVAAVSLFFAAGCSDEEDVADTQRTSIVSYLTSSHVPRLIAVEDMTEALERNPAFYERLEYNTFRYIATYYDEDRAAKRAVQPGDEVQLTFTAYIFTGGAPQLSSVYLTNDQSVIDALRGAGLNTEYWSAEPLRVKIGQTDIIKGVELSLLGCHVGDSVEAYMTVDAAYGDNVVGVVPKESSVAWFYTIDAIE